MCDPKAATAILTELVQEFNASKDARTKIKEKLSSLRVKMREAKTELKKATPIGVKNVTRGKYSGKIPRAELKRDERFVLMIFHGGWRLVTWAGKTPHGTFVVQTFPEIACRDFCGSFKNHLRTFTPIQREWYIVDALEIPANCQSIVLAGETAEVQSNLYAAYDAKKKLPRAKGKGLNKKFRK